MRKILIALLTMATGGAQAQQATLTITNPCDFQRHELVEVSLKDLTAKLGVRDAKELVVKNSIGQEIESQITADGLLLIDASIRPNATTTYEVTVGRPKTYRRWVYGRLVKERKDDFAWENDRGAYRVYGPALQKAGEKAYGVDVWVKNTPDFILNDRFQRDIEGVEKGRLLKAAGKTEEAKEMHLATSFHIDHGDGYDPYDVGPTLGCGTPGLLVDGTLKMPWCYTDYRLVDDGPLRLTVEFDYDGGEHRTLVVDKGSNFNRWTVTYDKVPRGAALAAGLVVHNADTTTVRLGKDYASYADPTDNINVNNSQVYVATLMPDGADATMLKPLPTQDGIRYGHALTIKKGIKAGTPYTYYFGAAWSRYDVRSQEVWQVVIDQFLTGKKKPLIVEVKRL